MNKMHSLYDHPQFADRYTLYFQGEPDARGMLECLGFNEDPQVFYQHGLGEPGPHNGKRITLDDLPEKLRDFVIKHEGL